ncbi:MAG: phosphatase [Lachnospiraceae bacterium]|nr:phosphatase [Lachnospiraceae bacterium]
MILMDLHTHTIASGHGYSTLKENIEMAQERGLKVLGLSEHAPGMPGGPNIMFFWNYKCIPRRYGDLRLMCGVEANICDLEGGLDVDDFTLSRMDYVIASMHTPCLKSGSAAENTRAAIGAMNNSYVTILGHPDDSRFPLDYDLLVREAVKAKVVLEVNNSSLHPLAARQGARENIILMLQKCKEYGGPIILGSDAHTCYAIGDFTEAEEVLVELNFPRELIVNESLENLSLIENKNNVLK